jgi:predicted Zn-dependent peptidase
MPAEPQPLEFPDDAFRRAVPEPASPRPFAMPPIRPFTLGNGIAVYLVEQHVLPIVSMQLELDGGALTDPPGKEGLAAVAMAMLTEGTQRLDKLAYAEALSDIASSISATATEDAFAISLASLTKHFDTTFQLFVETLREPGFRASDFDRLIKRRIESVRQARGTPAALPSRVSGPILFGSEHPFGAVVTESSLAAITLDDCKHVVERHLRPGRARLFVVGDLTEAEVRARVDVAGWSGDAPQTPPVPAPVPMAGRIFFVDVPGATQSQVLMMQHGPRRTDPGYFANTLLGAVFGGGFTSRINMNLREDKGYTYGARGGFSYTRWAGTFTASAQVRADATYQSLLEIVREVTALASGARPATADELAREKLGAILGLPGRFATAAAALGQYRGLVYFDLPLDYYTGYADGISRVTEAEVAGAAGQLDPARAVFVVVGDGATPLITRDGGADRPWLDDARPVTLRRALVERADVGGGGLVELDVDGVPLPRE